MLLLGLIVQMVFLHGSTLRQKAKKARWKMSELSIVAGVIVLLVIAIVPVLEENKR